MMWVLAGNGQEKSSETPRPVNEFSANATFQSRLHYFGRTDSYKSSGIFPSVTVQLKEGIYTTANFIFQQTSSFTKYTGASIEAGYKFPESDRFSGNLFFTKFLYDDESTLVQSSVKSQTGVNVSFLNKYVNLNLGADAKFSDDTDFGLTAGIDQLFVLEKVVKNAVLAINPSVYAYAGSQKFTSTYLKTKKKLLTLPLVAQKKVTETSKRFSLLAYEVMVPVVLVKGKFNFSVTPSYILPQNLIVVPDKPEQSEIGKNMLYVTVGIGVKI